MVKEDFIKKLMQEMDCSEEEAQKSYAAVIKCLRDMLIGGDSLTIAGFGQFSVVHRRGRMGIDPRNGKPAEIMPRAFPVFKAGGALKLHVRNWNAEETLKTEELSKV